MALSKLSSASCDLAHAVQRLADEVMRARLFWPERQRAAGEVDALLKLTFVAGNHRNVIKCIGVLRVVAQDLGIAVHRQRQLARPMVDQALLDEFGGSLWFVHAGL